MSITRKLFQQNFKNLMSKLKLDNVMAVPKLTKVVINVGVGKAKDQPNLVETLKADLAKISGQKPVVTKARKAIAAFKVQEGQAVGIMVTLRHQRMFDFVDRLIHVVLPAIRDFKGIPTSSIDRQGNLNLGLKEHTLFPEIGFENLSYVHGLQITVVPSTSKRNVAIALYQAMGFPIKE